MPVALMLHAKPCCFGIWICETFLVFNLLIYVIRKRLSALLTLLCVGLWFSSNQTDFVSLGKAVVLTSFLTKTPTCLLPFCQYLLPTEGGPAYEE